MAGRVGYRLASSGGVAAGSALAVFMANHPIAQRLTTSLPLLEQLAQTTLRPAALAPMAATTTAVVVLALLPLYRPRPRRVIDTVQETVRRVLVAGVALAALGYFDYTYRLARPTLVAAVALLAVALPVWLVILGRRPPATGGGAILVGDDPVELADVAQATDHAIVGYVAPPGCTPAESASAPGRVAVDGGALMVERSSEEAGTGDLERLGGLSRLSGLLVEHDVTVALLAFSRPDRAEFFGILETCHEHGVSTKVHREYANSVLVGNEDPDSQPLVDVDLEPWDPQDYMLKRGFDIGFALVGLLMATPLMAIIALAILVEDGGPVLYHQERTATFGGRFRVAKFRTLEPDGGDASPVDAESSRDVTRVGRVLRRTHLDELPQLWSIFVGRMSVVGPRAAWIEEESYLEETTEAWRKRWFVKPGLTGLAQVNGVTSTDPQRKLRYDVEYIRRQSFRFDIALVGRQVWQLLRELASLVQEDGENDPGSTGES